MSNIPLHRNQSITALSLFHERGLVQLNDCRSAAQPSLLYWTIPGEASHRICSRRFAKNGPNLITVVDCAGCFSATRGTGPQHDAGPNCRVHPRQFGTGLRLLDRRTENAWPTDRLYLSGWIMAATCGPRRVWRFPQLEADIFCRNKELMKVGAHVSPIGAQRINMLPAYATAWAIIGLSEQIDRAALLSPEDTRRAQGAIVSGVNWLVQHRSPKARWKPYPNWPSSVEFDSISGLVLHALHASHLPSTRALDMEWLENLPQRRIAASDEERIKGEGELRTPTGSVYDHFIQFPLPWILVATTDAYASGDLWQRSKALQWVETNATDETVKTSDSSENNWWRAELLYALRYMQNHH